MYMLHLFMKFSNTLIFNTSRNKLLSIYHLVQFYVVYLLPTLITLSFVRSANYLSQVVVHCDFEQYSIKSNVSFLRARSGLFSKVWQEANIKNNFRLYLSCQPFLQYVIFVTHEQSLNVMV
ncbi:hypothetical protein EDC96DRAFT_548206 [Choanephora cucurbitarum]|nr:hypothetical protein EDC96DRAFT_548206 [Choanephora cucurbitarum]